MPLLISITRLFFHPEKPEKVVKPYVGIIFLEYLKDFFGLKRGIEAEDDVRSLSEVSNYLVSVRKRFIEKEHVIHGFGYLLLTIYSSDQLNCDILEDSFHFLSLLIASLPALDGWDSISAVLTTLNYVCQCIDSETEMPIITLCAAMTVMARTALYGENSTVRDRSLQQLDATCSSFEAIVRGQPQYAQIILKSGMLKYVLCDTLQGVLHVQLLPLYLRVVDFVTAVIKKGPPDVATVQESGLLLLLDKILSPDYNTNSSSNINNSYNNNGNNSNNNSYSRNDDDTDPGPPLELIQLLLKFLEELVKAEPLHLEEIFRGIIRLLDALIPLNIPPQGPRSVSRIFEKKNTEKIILLCNCLGRIIKGRKEAMVVWRELHGLQWLIVSMGRLEGSFLSLPGLPRVGSYTAFSTAKLRAVSPSMVPSSSSGVNDSNSDSYSDSYSSSSSSSRVDDRFSGTTHTAHTAHTACVSEDPIAVVSTIHALMSCIAIDLQVFTPTDKKAKDYEMNRSISRCNYAHLTDALLATNIFSSAYAEYGLHALFGLMTGQTDLPDILSSTTPIDGDGDAVRHISSSSTSATSATSTSFPSSFPTSSASSSSSSSSSSTSFLSYVYNAQGSGRGGGRGGGRGRGRIAVPLGGEIICDMLLWLPSRIALRAILILKELAECSKEGIYVLYELYGQNIGRQHPNTTHNDNFLYSYFYNSILLQS
jgi:hypothetical protein